MVGASEEWKLGEIEFRDTARNGRDSKWDGSQENIQIPGGSSEGSSSDRDSRSRRKNKHHSKNPNICQERGESSHIIRHRKKSEQGAGAGGKVKSETDPGPGSNGQGRNRPRAGSDVSRPRQGQQAGPREDLYLLLRVWEGQRRAWLL